MLAKLTERSLLTYLDSVRRQVRADARAGGEIRLLGENVKQYAAELQAEMTRREIRFRPIEWK